MCYEGGRGVFPLEEYLAIAHYIVISKNANRDKYTVFLWEIGTIWPDLAGSPTFIYEKSPAQSAELQFVAEREGFEPPDPLRSTVFKTAAFDHSAISPIFQKRSRLSAKPQLLVKWITKVRIIF